VPVKILVVDDSVSVRNIMSMMLTNAGYEVIGVSRGTEATRLIDHSFQLVIMDYYLPDLNGIEATRTIRSGTQHAAVPIIMVTTEMDASKKWEAKAAGVSAWITKPFDQTSLLAVVGKLITTVSF